jgi:protein O-mannosyl-transferase
MPKEEEFSFKNLFVPLTTKKAIVFIVIIGFIVFANMLLNGFVLDDKTFIVSNPELHFNTISSLFSSSLFNSNGRYLPITAFYDTLVFNMFGAKSFYYHFLQLIIHICNAIFLFLLFKHFFNKKLSLFLSLIFLVHPIQVESVSYISSSNNPLFFILGISALILNIKENSSFKRLIAIFGLLLFCILTREAGILFLFVILLYQLFFKKGKKILFMVSAAIISIFYSSLVLGFAHIFTVKPEAASISQLTFFQRLINIPAVIFYYLKTLFFPIKLAIDQQWTINSLNFQGFFLPLIMNTLFFLSLITLGIFVFKKNEKAIRAYLFFSLWFIAGLAFHSQIFPLDSTVADRWMYFPMVGLLGVAGVILNTFNLVHEKTKTALYLCGFIIIILLSVRTVSRNADWRDALTLYIHDSKIHTNYDIENNIGLEYVAVGNYKEAIVHYEKSVEMYPYDATISNLAQSYDKIGEMKLAKKYYIESITAKHKSSKTRKLVLVLAYERLGYLSIRIDRPEESIKFIKGALQLYPNSVNLWFDLAVSENRLGKKAEALDAAGKVKELFPTDQTNYYYNQILNNKTIQLN